MTEHEMKKALRAYGAPSSLSVRKRASSGNMDEQGFVKGQNEVWREFEDGSPSSNSVRLSRLGSARDPIASASSNILSGSLNGQDLGKEAEEVLAVAGKKMAISSAFQVESLSRDGSMVRYPPSVPEEEEVQHLQQADQQVQEDEVAKLQEQLTRAQDWARELFSKCERMESELSLAKRLIDGEASVTFKSDADQDSFRRRTLGSSVDDLMGLVEGVTSSKVLL